MKMASILFTLEVLLSMATVFIAFQIDHSNISKRSRKIFMISSGFSYQGERDNQVLVSVQKPLGILLEEKNDDDNGNVYVDVVEIGPNSAADRAGIKVGDVILAVQNADMRNKSLDMVLQSIGNAPKVVNLRFLRPKLRDSS